MRILVVEDDLPLADVIMRGLRRQALAVDTAADGASALKKLDDVPYDVVVLDRDLPVVHGDDVCHRLVGRRSTAKVLMLTASSSLDDRVEGLSIGADDYLAKPFAMKELVARVHALGRRVTLSRPPILRWSDVTLDAANHRTTRAGRALPLTNREFSLLEHLLSNAGAVASPEELMEHVWDDRLDPFSNVVRVTILTLRRKLGEPPIIETLPGVGYRLA
jgi:DNA-binding response OmpR family regulator